MIYKCKKCGHKELSVRAIVEDWVADDEPYEKDKEEDHDGVLHEICFAGEYCEKCKTFNHIDVDDVQEKISCNYDRVDIEDKNIKPIKDIEINTFPCLLNSSFIANFLQVSESKVRQLLNTKQIHSIKLGKGYRVSKEDLIAFYKKNGGEHLNLSKSHRKPPLL